MSAGEALGVSEGTIRRWRSGNIAVPLRNATRVSLQRFLAREAWAGQEQVLDGVAGAAVEPFASVSAVRTYLAELGPPGQGAARKLDVLEGVRQVIGARSPVPDWWYALRDDVRGSVL